MRIYICVYIYICVCVCVYVCIYIYICIYILSKLAQVPEQSELILRAYLLAAGS